MPTITVGPEEWRRGRRLHGQPEVSDAERRARHARRSSPHPIWPYGLAFALLFVGSFTLLYWRRDRVEVLERRAAALPAPSLPLTGPSHAEIRRLSVAFDWTVRRALQAELPSLARHLRTDSSESRRDAAREVLALLRAHVSGARYSLAVHRRVDIAEAPGAFGALAVDLRSRFRVETRGRGEGQAVPALRARPEEGEGLVVVTLLFGATTLERPSSIDDRGALGQLLEQWLREAVPLDGFDVIWSPAEEDDRLSSHELELIYPELAKLADARGLGTARCAHCSFIRPAEVSACPQCGSIEVVASLA